MRFETGIHESYSIFNKRKIVSNDLLLILDEGDLGFHPEWKKKYIKSIQQVIPLIFKDRNIQIIITTHDPLTLSDFPKNNVVYLKKENGLTVQYANDDIRSFGANVSDLFKNSFFIKDGLIGDFAKDKIEELITKLNRWLELKTTGKAIEVSIQEMENVRKTISIIDEPIIQQKLIEMYNVAFDESVALDDEISKLEEQLRTLKKIGYNGDADPGNGHIDPLVGFGSAKLAA